MFNQVFYHDTIRKYVILFGTLFNVNEESVETVLKEGEIVSN